MRRIALAAGSTLLFAGRLCAQAPDPVLARIEALEAKVNALEARNRELESQARATAPARRVDQSVPAPDQVARRVVPATTPGFAAPPPDFTIVPRATMQIDYAAYHTRAGGYRYDTGTDIRRGRFGFEGTAFRAFRYRINAEFVKNNVNLLDAFVQYGGIDHLALTVGQHKAPFGLEANNLDPANIFLERGMAVDAFSAIGAERRVGASIAYQAGPLLATIGVFGASEAVTRNPATPDETQSVNGRITWEPALGDRRQIHVGVAGYHVGRIAAKTLANIGDRPGVRVDGGLLETVTIGPVAGVTRGTRSANYVGAEGAGVWGPVTLQGEYGHLAVRRYDAAPTIDFAGYYGTASLFLTGESRTYHDGVVERVHLRHDFSLAQHHWGAFELAFRYDRLDLSDAALGPLDRSATTLTGGLNWYLNPYLRLVFNYIRFTGRNSPLVVAPVAIYGTTARGDVYATRMQFDF